MKSIETRYIGPSNTRGSRIMATDCGDHRIYVSADSALSNEYLHWDAAQTLARKLGWTGDMVAGGTKQGYVFVFADGQRFII
jgi:hypothetical protein